MKNKNTNNILLKQSFWEKIGIWRPSFRSIFILGGIILTFWFLTRVNCFFGIHIGKIDEVSATLFDIHLGIGAVLIPLALFTAESMLSGKTEKAEVLLDESIFFPLVVLHIFSFSLFLGSPNMIIFVPIFGIALITIISLKNTTKILLYPELLEKKEKELIIKKARNEFLNKLNQEISFREKNNSLFEVRKDDSTLSTNPFTFRNGEDNIATITSHKRGIVLNIDFKKLNDLDDYITKRLLTRNDARSASETTQDENKKIKPTTPLSNLKVLFGSVVKPDDDLFEINKDYFQELDLSRVEKMIHSAIQIDESYDNNLASKYLRRLKDRCIQSISNDEIGELDKNLNIYIDILDSFYDYLSNHGGGFSEKQASEERQSFIGRLESLQWIHEDIIDIFEKGIDAKQRKIIREVAYLPIRMMRKAVENEDHLIFQEFLVFPKLLYQKALRLNIKDSGYDNKKFMIDRSWRYLKEFSFFYLESERSNLPEENILSYGVNILQTFQSLIKLAIDNEDISSFNLFSHQARELFGSLEREYRYNREEENIYEQLDRKRNEMFFGVASWLLFLLQRNPENENILKMFNSIKSKLPQNIKDFSSLFNQVHSFDVEDFWGWNHWETALYPEGRVHSIQILEKLEVLFAVHSLKLLRSKTDEEVEGMQLDTSRDLAHLSEGSRSLISTLDKIKSDPNNWRFVLDDQSIAQVENFKKLLNKVKQDQEEIDTERKRAANISIEKVTEFKKNLLSNYEQSFPVSGLMKIYESYTEKLSELNDGIDAIGINTLFDKAAFLGKDVGWHVHYTGDDEAFGFGRTMSHGENKKVFEIIKEASNKISQEEMDDFFKGKDLDDYIILTTNNAIWRAFEYGKENYIPKWRQDFPKDEEYSKAEGVLKINETYIPVFIFFVSDSDLSEVYILNKKELGEFTHWKPLDESDALTGVFDIQIITLEEGSEEANKILNNPPEWISEIDGEDARLKYLQERLIIKVFEKFSYLPSDNFDGVYIEIEK